MAAKAAYFLSIDPRNPNAKTGPSALTENEVLNNFMHSGNFWKQVEGAYTETILDDRYEVVSWSIAPPITGGTPETWAVFFYSLSGGFLWLTVCVLCCCCCYVRTWMQSVSQSRAICNQQSALSNQSHMVGTGEFRRPMVFFSDPR